MLTDKQMQFADHLDLDLVKLRGSYSSAWLRVDEGIRRIQDAPFLEKEKVGLFVGHSGGKDSVVVRWLTDNAFKDVPTVHTVKSAGVRNAVHSLTRDFLYSLGRPVLYVPDNAELLYSLGLDTQIDGTRRAEASRRDGRDVGLIVNGNERSRAETPLYLENGIFGLNLIYPIFDWSDEDVWATIFAYDIPYSLEYEL